MVMLIVLAMPSPAGRTMGPFVRLAQTGTALPVAVGGITRVGVFVIVGVNVGEGVTEGVSVNTGVGDGVKVGVFVGVGVGVGVLVGVQVGVNGVYVDGTIVTTIGTLTKMVRALCEVMGLGSGLSFERSRKGTILGTIGM
jgi:hypothetical protein